MIYPFIKRNNTEILSYHYIIICTGYHLMTKIVQNKCAIYLDIALPHRLQIRVYTCTRSVLAGYSTRHSQHTWLPQQGRHTHWYLEYEYHITFNMRKLCLTYSRKDIGHWKVQHIGLHANYDTIFRNTLFIISCI